jgi:hypothetical protein
MKKQLISIVVILFVGILPRLTSAQDEGKEEPPHYQSTQFSCRVKNADDWLKAAQNVGYGSAVELSRGGRGVSYLNVLDSLTNSQALIGPVAAEVLQKPAKVITVIPFGDWQEVFDAREQLGKKAGEQIFISARFESGRTGEPTGASGDRVVMNLVVFPPTGNDALPGRLAERVAEAVAKNLPKASEATLTEAYKAAIQKYEDEIQTNTRIIDSSEDERRERLKDRPLPLDKILERIAAVDQQLLTTELALTGSEARMDAVKEQIAIVAKNLKEDSTKDEMGEALRGLIKAREAEVEHLKDANRKAPGSVSQGELDRAAGKVLESRIQLLQSQNKHRETAESDRLGSLNNELTKLVVDVAESKAKRDYLMKTRHELIELRVAYPSSEERIDVLTSRIAGASQVSESTTRRLNAFKGVEKSIKPLELVMPLSEAK